MLKLFELYSRWISNHRIPHSPVDTFLDAEATVADGIPPGGQGKIRLFGSYWPAKAEAVTKWEIPIGARVVVQRREGIVLVVIPLPVRPPQGPESIEAKKQSPFISAV